MFRTGRYELHAIDTGRFRLDGGSMFGVVPHTLWHKRTPADELNRIQLCMRSLLAIDRAAGRVILVDSGAGDKWDDVEIDRFAFEIADDPLGQGLQSLGIGDDDVTDVVVTHLHFDHNAGLTRWADAGRDRAIPRFSKARHWIHEAQLGHAMSPSPKDRGSFMPRDFLAIQDADLFATLGGQDPLCPFDDAAWVVAHGHTPFQLLPRFRGGEGAVQYLADLIPTSAHMPLAWVMAYDNEPLKTVQEKKMIYADCAREDLVLMFEHDPEVAGVRLDVSGKRPEIREHVAL